MTTENVQAGHFWAMKAVSPVLQTKLAFAIMITFDDGGCKPCTQTVFYLLSYF